MVVGRCSQISISSESGAITYAGTPSDLAESSRHSRSAAMSGLSSSFARRGAAIGAPGSTVTRRAAGSWSSIRNGLGRSTSGASAGAGSPPRPRERELAPRAGQAHVQEPTLLGELGVALRLANRQGPVLEAGQDHGVPLEALGAMEREQVHTFGAALGLSGGARFELCHQSRSIRVVAGIHRVLGELVQQRQPGLPLAGLRPTGRGAPRRRVVLGLEPKILSQSGHRTRRAVASRRCRPAAAAGAGVPASPPAGRRTAGRGRRTGSAPS